MENQLSLKKAKSTDFKFTRNIIGEPHQRKVKKIGHLNPLKLSKNPKFINFVEEAEKCTNYETGLEVYKAWRLCNIPKRVVSKTFAKEGILLLIAKKKNYGDNW